MQGERQERDSPPETVLVLGGGGMKGVAHVGAWKALDEAGFRPDAIIGTSIGSVVGACLAAGLGWRELAEIARAVRKDDIVSINRRAIWLGGVRETSVFEAERYREWLERSLPVDSFEDVGIPLRMNAVSLISGKEVWFGHGAVENLPLLEAVYASCALPVYFPPAEIDGDLLVDGGMLDVLPILQAAEWGARRIIAVDLGADMMIPEASVFDRGMIPVHDRVVNLLIRKQHELIWKAWEGPPVLHIRPRLGTLTNWEFERSQFLLEEGYRAARLALESADGFFDRGEGPEPDREPDSATDRFRGWMRSARHRLKAG